MNTGLRTLKFSIVLLVVMVAFASCSKGQITFSRDWLAGSGKRAQAVTFSRDWLAGSGKRSGAEAPMVHMQPRAAIQFLVEYLAAQLSDPVAQKISFMNYLDNKAETI